MTSTAVPINTATKADAEPVIATLVAAFVSDPMIRWGYPDPQRYLADFPAFVKAFGGRAFENGTAYSAIGYAGAALWLPPGVRPDEEAFAEVLEKSIPRESQEAVLDILEQMAAFHPAEPHWYLPLLGVDPLWQRKGLGSALLAHALARCDEDGTVAYLESSNPLNVRLYQRHGFEVIGEIQAGTSPTIWPMLRKRQ